MHSYPSRAETREILFYGAAEKGCLSYDNIILYPSEIKRLEKDGFFITNIKPSGIKPNLFSVTVSWANAFGLAIPHIIHSYIIGIIETKPSHHIHNFAQTLYVIAKKAKK